MSVAPRTGVEAIRSISARSDGQPLDERVAAERHDARDVLVRAWPRRLSRRKASASSRPAVPDRVGQVDDVHDGQPVDREHELEPGERDHEQRQQDRPGRRAPTRRRPLPSRRRDVRWSATTTAMSGGRSSSASGASKLMPIRRPGPRGVAAARAAQRSRAAAGPACRARRPATRAVSTSSAISTIGIQISSRAFGRLAGGAAGPGAGAAPPSAGERGRRRRARSATRRRRAGRPRTGPGRRGRRGGTWARRRARPTPPGRCAALGSAPRRTARRTRRGRRSHVTV